MSELHDKDGILKQNKDTELFVSKESTRRYPNISDGIYKGSSVSLGFAKYPGYETTPSSDVISITNQSTGMTRVVPKDEFRKKSIDSTVAYALSNNENVRDLVEKRVKGVNDIIMAGERTTYGESRDIMSTFTNDERKYLLARHKASELSNMAYDAEVGGTVVSRAMAARKDVEGTRDALNASHGEDEAKSGVKYSDVVDAKDDAAKSIFMSSGMGDEEAYYDKMREDYMKSALKQFDDINIDAPDLSKGSGEGMDF